MSEYFHVRIEEKTASRLVPIRKHYKFDVSVTQVHGQFAVPYRQGQAILISGRTVRADRLDRITIAKGTVPAEITKRSIHAQAEADGFGGEAGTDEDVFRWLADVTDEILVGPSPTNSQDKGEQMSVVNSNRIFLVHGRDETNNEAMKNFLRSIGLSPIDWAEARADTRNPNPYIGEILEAGLKMAKAVVVLFTPDEEVRLVDSLAGEPDAEIEGTYSLQARPNVIFEAGLAMGRYPERTVLVEVGTLRPFSDVSGKHMVRVDSDVEWRHELAKRLSDAGCGVQTDGTSWYKAGGFSLAK